MTLRDARQAHARLVAAAHVRRKRAAAARGVARDERDRYVVAVIPHNDARVSRLPHSRREALERVLRSNVAEARALLRSDAPIEPESLLPALPATRASAAQQRAESTLRAAGCAACRGHCCMAGGNHAFNRAETMVRVLRANSAWSDDEIVQVYVSHVAERTMTDGCVFQGERGCTLTRELRSEMCNRYECNGLRTLREHFDEGEPVRAYFVNRKGASLRGGEFVEIVRRQIG